MKTNEGKLFWSLLALGPICYLVLLIAGVVKSYLRPTAYGFDPFLAIVGVLVLCPPLPWLLGGFVLAAIVKGLGALFGKPKQENHDRGEGQL